MRVWAAVRVQHGIAGSSVVASAFLIFYWYSLFLIIIMCLCHSCVGQEEVAMNSLVADAAGLDLFLSYLNFPFVFLISLNILKLFFILLIIMPESVSCGTLQLFVENLGSLSTSSFSSSELEPIPGMWYCFRSSTMILLLSTPIHLVQ